MCVRISMAFDNMNSKIYVVWFLKWQALENEFQIEAANYKLLQITIFLATSKKHVRKWFGAAVWYVYLLLQKVTAPFVGKFFFFSSTGFTSEKFKISWTGFKVFQYLEQPFFQELDS